VAANFVLKHNTEMQTLLSHRDHGISTFGIVSTDLVAKLVPVTGTNKYEVGDVWKRVHTKTANNTLLFFCDARRMSRHLLAASLTRNRPAAATTGAMLRWTRRLRDEIERRGFWIDDFAIDGQPLRDIREAQFVCDDGGFPHGFRWDTLASCYSQEGHNVVLVPHGSTGSRPIDPSHASYRAIRSLSGKEITDLTRNNINVLWLSQTVFISQIFFNLDGCCVDEYKLTFRYGGYDGMGIYVYALSSFEHGEPDIHSPVPIAFLRHVTALLPMGHISEVLVARDHLQRCPLEMAFQIV
jgi:hypothetical protein